MKRIVSVMPVIAATLLVSSSACSFGQAKRYIEVSGTKMDTSPSLYSTKEDQAAAVAPQRSGEQVLWIVYPYHFATNFPDRKGCIVNLCPTLVTVKDFSFGNTVEGIQWPNGIGFDVDRLGQSEARYRSQFSYLWLVHSSNIISFSISTIEYDPFGNPLESVDWVFPIDDAGLSKKSILTGTASDNPSADSRRPSNYDRVIYESGASKPHTFETGTTYASTFFVKSKDESDFLIHPADWVEKAKAAIEGLPDEPRQVAVAKAALKASSTFLDSKRIPENHSQPEGLSTRFTVVTFVSNVVYKNTDGKIKKWSISPRIWAFADAYDGGYSDAADFIINHLIENASPTDVPE